jgi:hypothetical protein
MKHKQHIHIVRALNQCSDPRDITYDNETAIQMHMCDRHYTTEYLENVHILKLYNDQCNAQVFNLFIYLLLPYMLRLSFSPSSDAGVQFRQWFKSPGYGVRGRVLTPVPGVVNHWRNCTPTLEDGLKESPKHVWQK